MATKSRLRKGHAKKVAARNIRIKEEQNKLRRMLQKAYLEQQKAENGEQIDQLPAGAAI